MSSRRPPPPSHPLIVTRRQRRWPPVIGRHRTSIADPFARTSATDEPGRSGFGRAVVAARKLLETMTTMAGERGLRTLDLTSRPWRESALRLYEAVGFRRRETNILRSPSTVSRSTSPWWPKLSITGLSPRAESIEVFVTEDHSQAEALAGRVSPSSGSVFLPAARFCDKGQGLSAAVLGLVRPPRCVAGQPCGGM
jgi:hypothetical protein